MVHRLWGWESTFDLALFRSLEHLFPGLRLIYLAHDDPAVEGAALNGQFREKLAHTRSHASYRTKDIIEIDGQVPVQMHVLNVEGRGYLGPHPRFTLRCMNLQGAAGLVQAYDRIARAAASRIGPSHSLLLSADEALADMDGAAARALETIWAKD